ncbi:MAG: hypothetical protein EAZ91_00375 [Cytophagales bacterium]|nr:MAG: hypothetical protein EAZ91_00375 [Cytophagales bacterium]
MSNLGIFHTVVGVVALFLAALSLVQRGKIGFSNRIDLVYIVLTLITCATSFMIFKTGQAGPGHIIAGLVVVCLGIGYFTRNSNNFWGKFISVVSMSATVFLSLIPTINETLTRLPVSGPLADSPEHPVVQNSVKVLLVFFALGVYLQFRSLKKKEAVAEKTLYENQV